jgi:ketosteroid isomerase-like protein
VLAEGEFLSRTVDGRQLHFPLAMVLEVRDGLVVRFTEYFDTAPLR